jgi:hypothetical protein
MPGKHTWLLASYFSGLRAAPVECGSLLPLFAARACPGALLAAGILRRFTSHAVILLLLPLPL